MPEAHALAASDVATRLGVDPAHGLDAEVAAQRLATDGPNELEPARRPSLLSSIVEAATEPFVIMLAVAGVLAVLLGEVRDGILVLLGLVPIVGADVVTTYRGERALESLRDAAAPVAHVRRDGTISTVPARDLVEGDVVLLRVGDIVPADLRIIRSAALTADRSILTGESVPEELSVAPDAGGSALVDRRAIAHSGTAIVLGHGEGIVSATGRRTEIGRIASALAPRRHGRSPLQRELDRLVRILLVVAIGLVAITFGLGLIRGGSLGAAVLAGISAAIAAIPEEPPVLLAVILGFGAVRLLRRGVLVRRLNAQETLGAIDLIVTDKTGTLTENRLGLATVATPAGEVTGAERTALIQEAIRAEDDAWHPTASSRTGSFTRALVAAVGGAREDLDPSDLLDAHGPTAELPLSRTRARRGPEVEELAIGAPERVLALCSVPDVGPWVELIHRSAGSGRRLLLLASRDGGAAWQPRAILSFVDTLRPGIGEALADARAAGIQVLIVTGDHPVTAEAIAAAAGLARGGRTITGEQLESIDDSQLAGWLPNLEVVARATPDQKLRIVRVARSVGRTVAVTGDGVNDAPALQNGDVGVAMGSGTAVAREAADLVLGDDSFATLMDGLREGRRIVANVQKGLVFLTSTHVALLGFILLATLAGFGQPLLPVQILWLELFIDLAAAIAFEREPAEPDVMQRPPQPRQVPLLTTGILVRIAFAGGVTAIAALALLGWHGADLDHARWLAFSALVYGQLARAYANRSLTHPLRDLRANRFLAGACIAAGAIQFAIPYVPWLSEAFRATTLDGTDLALVALIAGTPVVVAEALRSTRHRAWVA